MTNPRIAAVLAAIACTSAATATSAANFMDAAWAASACSAWNNTPTLVNELGGKLWAANDGGRGYKVIQLYRTKCGESSKVELEIQNKDDKAHCAWGGEVKLRKVEIVSAGDTRLLLGERVEYVTLMDENDRVSAESKQPAHYKPLDTLDPRYDYLMNATDEDWACMGKGTFGCGAMGAMTTGKLKFKGPKMEAMGVMGPFDNFLLLTGKVGGDTSACPK